MKRVLFSGLIAGVLVVLPTSVVQAEILAMLNYEGKPGHRIRKEGLAIIDVDPKSSGFGNILMDIPLPSDLVAHDLYYNRDMSKAYVTALGKSVLHVLDLKRSPYRMKAVEIPDCRVQEDIVFSEDNRTWYLTCMGSNNVIMGDARSDTSQAGERITVLEANTGKVLSAHKVPLKASPSRAAPVEVMFSPKANPPIAHITNMLEGTLWMAAWNQKSKSFNFEQVDDFGPRE